jgi:hypothetical protein
VRLVMTKIPILNDLAWIGRTSSTVANDDG